MPLPSPPAAASSRLPLPRRTIRLRLTLVYGALFLLSGAALLAVTYLLVRFTFPGASTHTYNSRHPSASGLGRLAPLPNLASLQAQTARQRTADLNHLLLISGIALAGMVVASLGLGWIVAGRVLRPLRTIIATARDLSSANLDRRLALPGPDDELKELGDTFDGLLGRLEASFVSQRQFVANASHELRTPLTLQRALLESAIAKPDATAASMRAACERVLVATTEQERLIEALLTLATTERGLDHWEPFDLAEVAAAVVDARQAHAARLGLCLETTLKRAPCAGAPDLVARLVANLVDNAMRYNGPEGQVEIITGSDSEHAIVRVINTGPHIPADRIAVLFQPFQRLGNNRTRHDNAHGLGLSIVAAIATAHGAEIVAQPRTDGGLDITVRFPIGVARDQAPQKRFSSPWPLRAG